MTHKPKKIRSLTQNERLYLEEVSYSQVEATGRILRAKVLLALDRGKTCAEAARESMGFISESEACRLAKQFNRLGLNALNYSIPLNRSQSIRSRFAGLRSNLSRRFRNLSNAVRTPFHFFNRSRQQSSRRTQSTSRRQAASSSNEWFQNFVSQLRAIVLSPFRLVSTGLTWGIRALAGGRRSLNSFVRSKRGIATVALMTVLIVFGAWRIALSDPFDPGYIAIKPVNLSDQLNLDLEPVEVPPTRTQFASPKPEVIPVIQQSEASSPTSTIPVALKNFGNGSVTITFTNSQSKIKYSLSLEKEEAKRVRLPFGIYQINYSPSVSGGDREIQLHSGLREYRACVYVTYYGVGSLIPLSEASSQCDAFLRQG